LVNLKKQFKDGFGVKVPKKINVSFFEYAFSLFEAGPDAATMAKWEWEDKIKSKMGGIRKEYNQFIYSSIDKLDRYKDILGKSVLLCELIRRFKSKLILRRVKSTRYKPYPKKPSEPRRKTPGRAPYLGFFDAIFIIPIFIYLSEKKTYEAKCLELKMKYEHELEQYQEDMRQYELDCSEIRTENESRKAEAERYYDELEKAFSVV
jgi:hypothetical protein